MNCCLSSQAAQREPIDQARQDVRNENETEGVANAGARRCGHDEEKHLGEDTRSRMERQVDTRSTRPQQLS